MSRVHYKVGDGASCGHHMRNGIRVSQVRLTADPGQVTCGHCHLLFAKFKCPCCGTESVIP